MDKDGLAKRWVKHLNAVFPKDADIDYDVNHDIELSINWPLHEDASRSNKSSRIILLKITHEAVSDCRDLEFADRKLKQFVEEKLLYFNQDHEHPATQSPPVEVWLVSTHDLN